MNKKKMSPIRWVLYFSLFLGSLAEATDLKSASDVVDRDFTNYIMRAYEISAESPDHYLNNILKANLLGVKQVLDEYFSSNPVSDAKPTYQVRELLFIRDMLSEALKAIEDTEAYYEDLDNGLSPYSARVWSFENMVQSKIRMLRIFKDYLAWVQDPVNIRTVTSDPIFSKRSLHIAFSMKTLMSHRFESSFEEHDRYRQAILEPAADSVVSYLKWLETLNINQVAYFNHLFLGSLGSEAIFYIPLFNRLIREENRNLWALDKRVKDRQHSYAGFDFIIRYGRTYLDSDESSVNFEDLLKSTLTDDEKKQFHQIWGSYFPEALTEYLLSESAQVTHVELLNHLYRIKKSWKKYESVLTEVGITSPPKSQFQSFLFHKLGNIDYSRSKGINDVISIVHALFSGYEPPGADSPGQAFNPNPAHVFSSHTNPKSILNSAVYSLSSQPPVLLRKFFERLIQDFVRLSDQMTPLTAGDMSELSSLFISYGKLKMRSESIEEVALFVLRNTKAFTEDRIFAGKFLLESSKSEYSYVSAQLERLRPSVKRFMKRTYGPDVRVIGPDFDPEADYGELVYHISPYTLVETVQSCQSLLAP